MPVKLWTGLPGAGKTAAMVAGILEFKREFPHRPVYAINVNGLHESVAQPLTIEQLQRWWELPPEALICIDEAQESSFMPLDSGKPSDWVKHISKVRHEGMDFWLTTQHPNLISAYVRRLVDQHVHFVRKYNTSIVLRHAWGRCMENCEKDSAQRSAASGVVTLPKEVFDLYKSSNAHNMKRRVPFKAWMLPACAVIAVAAVLFLPVALKRMHEKAVAPAAAQAGGKASPSTDLRVVDDGMRQSNFAKWMKPRVDGLPWSAPMFDHLEVQAQPRLYCIAGDDGRCNCITEQGTHYEVGLKQCRAIVQNGLYNPFASPVADADDRGSRRVQGGRDAQRVTAKPSDGRPGLISGDDVAASASWKVSPMQSDYVPPQIEPRPAYAPRMP